MWVNEYAVREEPALATSENTTNTPPVSDPRSAWRPPVALLGVAFDNLTLADAIRGIEAMVLSRRPHYVVTANVDFLVQARRDAELRRILLDADLVVCDGTPLVWASHLLGNPLPERVAGADLVPQLIHVAAAKHYRLFFLGATAEANAQAAANVRTQFQNAVIAGHYSPPFCPLCEMDHEEIARRIRAVRPDLLFVAFGCPKAEKWIAMNYQALGVPVTIGVGGTIDFLAGRLKRAPIWLQRAGLEWCFRLGQEPRRLFKRYATDLWRFGWGMAAQIGRMSVCLERTQKHTDCALINSMATWQRIRAPRIFDAKAIRGVTDLWQSANDRHCLFDMMDVKFVDSTGIGLLLRLRKKLHAAGRCLVLLSPSPAVQRALKWMRVWGAFLTADNAIEARWLIESEAQKRSTKVAS